MIKYNTISLTDVPAYYINMDQDISKKEHIEKTLKDLGFKKIHRFPGIKGQTKKLGVALSHHALLKEIRKVRGPVLVFEDDIVVHRFEPTVQVPESADAYYLGTSFYGLYNGLGKRKISAERFDDKSHRIYNMLSAHAILYTNKEYIDFLIKAIEFNISIGTNQDKARAETMKYFNIYGVSRPMFYQHGINEKATKMSLPHARVFTKDGAFTF